MSSIGFIYFDLGNVIFRFSHERAAKQIADVCGLDQQTVKQHVFESELQLNYEKGLLNSDQFHADFCQRTGCNVGLADLLAAGSDIFELNIGIGPLITQLRAVGFPMSILSNTCSAHWNFITGRFPCILDWFDHYLLSYEAHCLKPETQIYQLAIQRAGVSAESIFFTDDRAENVAAAKQAGLQSVQFSSPEQLYRELSSRGVQINL